MPQKSFAGVTGGYLQSVFNRYLYKKRKLQIFYFTKPKISGNVYRKQRWLPEKGVHNFCERFFTHVGLSQIEMNRLKYLPVNIKNKAERENLLWQKN